MSYEDGIFIKKIFWVEQYMLNVMGSTSDTSQTNLGNAMRAALSLYYVHDQCM
jgi:hypothetical protein